MTRRGGSGSNGPGACWIARGPGEAPIALGDGGIPAPGEHDLEDRIERGIPNPEAGPAAWRGKTTLLVGGGHSAQTAARELAALAAGDSRTRVVWALRAREPSWPADPEDALPERARLEAEAYRLVAGGLDGFEVRRGVVIDALERVDGRIRVHLRGPDGREEPELVDRVVGLTGTSGDPSIHRELQVHQCYATEGPMKLAAALLASGATGTGGDCLDQESHGPDTLRSPEPGFFILGEKSYGRNNTFLLRVGWQQVDEVFGALIP